jgi:hypothetical protein
MDPVRCVTESKSELVDSCSPLVITFDWSSIQRHGRGLCRQIWTGFPHARLPFALDLPAWPRGKRIRVDAWMCAVSRTALSRGLILLDFEERRLHRRALSVAFKPLALGSGTSSRSEEMTKVKLAAEDISPTQYEGGSPPVGAALIAGPRNAARLTEISERRDGRRSSGPSFHLLFARAAPLHWPTLPPPSTGYSRVSAKFRADGD